MSEHHEQIAVVAWFKIQYPAFAECIIAIPNGAHLAGNAVQRARKMHRMKLEGFKPGASDLFIAVPRGTYHGLWIEMKGQGKTFSSVSQNQRDHLSKMSEMNYSAHWCAGADDAIKEIKQYMKSE